MTIIYERYRIYNDVLFIKYFEHVIPSAPIDTNFTPLLAMKSRALFTLAILWKRILPLSGFGNVSPEITSRSNMSFRPLRKSSSMLSIAVPALRKCELHHAVKVYKNDKKEKHYVFN